MTLNLVKADECWEAQVCTLQEGGALGEGVSSAADAVPVCLVAGLQPGQDSCAA